MWLSLVRKLCHYTLDKRPFESRCLLALFRAGDALNTDLNTCTATTATVAVPLQRTDRGLRHVTGQVSRVSVSKQAACLQNIVLLVRGSFVRPPFEICYDPFRVENRFSELDPKVFVLLFLFNDLPVFIYTRVRIYVHIHRIRSLILTPSTHTCAAYLYTRLFISNDLIVKIIR